MRDIYEAFESELQKYLEQYLVYLSDELKPATINKYEMVLVYWIEFLCSGNLAGNFEEIRLSHISSDFHSDFEAHTQEGLSRETKFRIIHKFLVFIYDTYGVRNPELMRKLAKK
jgi:hypothetical protein